MTRAGHKADSCFNCFQFIVVFPVLNLRRYYLELNTKQRKEWEQKLEELKKAAEEEVSQLHSFAVMMLVFLRQNRQVKTREGSSGWDSRRRQWRRRRREVNSSVEELNEVAMDRGGADFAVILAVSDLELLSKLLTLFKSCMHRHKCHIPRHIN